MESKAISYTIYRDNPILFNWYLRGLYFNVRLSAYLLPDYVVFINVSKDVYDDYKEFINGLDCPIHVYESSQRCRNMMQRFYPRKFYNRIICRDADSCLTWREVKCIRDWESSGLDWHGINDNPAHTIPMMGGMIGFKSSAIDFDLDKLIGESDLSYHGSDQELIMKHIYPKVKDKLYLSVLNNREPQPDNDWRWVTDLFQRYIGSAGSIEMEVVRFLSCLPNNEYWLNFEKENKKIFYWHE